MIYFRLTGGLGNQLFGLNEAYGIHRKTGKRLAVDIGALEHTSADGPEWLVWSEEQHWMVLIRIPENVSSEFSLINLGVTEAPLNRIESNKFTGWNFSLQRVRNFGLFREGEFPFRNEDWGSDWIAIHHRVGDYANSHGIGVVGSTYFKRALRVLKSENKINIFSDDIESAAFLIDTLNLANASIDKSRNAMDVLARISRSKYIIATNSTLSWWAIYFSKANTVICPTPFYLQDWSFDREAVFPNAIYLSRFNNQIHKISMRLLWKFRSIKRLRKS